MVRLRATARRPTYTRPVTPATPVVSLFPERQPSPPTPFDSWVHRQKLCRAAIHISQIQAACEAWATRDGFRVFTEPDGQGGELVQIEMLKPLPDDLSVIIGDALQCLRHSLDNLAFSLALANNRTLTAKQEEEISFPIYDHHVTERTKVIQLMSQSVKDDISSVAPDPTRLVLDQDPLWLLNKAVDRDSHRGISVAASAATTAGVVLGGAMWTGDLLTGHKRMEVGAEPVSVGKLMLNNPVRAELRYRVQVQFQGPVEVQGRGIIGTLWWFHDHIRDVVFKALERHLNP